jgi:hypothetical protein
MTKRKHLRVDSQTSKPGFRIPLKKSHSAQNRKVELQNPSAENSGTLSRFCNFRHVCPSCRMTREEAFER